MATRLYLRAAAAASSPTAGEKSTALPVGTFSGNSGATFESLSLSTTKGTAQTTRTKDSLAQTAHQDNYIARFSSPGLAALTISAQTWTVALALSEGNAAANAFLAVSLYVWRPGSNILVGYVRDADSALGIEWATSEDGIVATFSGSSVVCQAGDILVLEVWNHASQSMAVAYTNTLYFDGTTDVVDATSTDAASYVESPQTMTWNAVSVTGTDSATASDSATSDGSSLTGTDSAVGAESATTAATTAGTESASGADTASLSVAVTGTDTLSTADVGIGPPARWVGPVLMAAGGLVRLNPPPAARWYSVALMGAGGLAQTPNAVVPVSGSDSASASEDASVSPIGTDSAAATETASVSASLVVTESGSAQDDGSVAALLTGTDSASGSESGDVDAELPVGDSASGDEAGAVAATLNADDGVVTDDAGTGQDLGNTVGGSDSASGSDNAGTTAQVTGTESVAGTESGTVGASLTVSDSAVASESVSVLRSDQGMDRPCTTLVRQEKPSTTLTSTKPRSTLISTKPTSTLTRRGCDE